MWLVISPRLAAVGWAALGFLVIAFGLLLTLASPRFGYAYDVADMPVVWLTAGLVCAGLIYCLLLPTIISNAPAGDARALRFITIWIITVGFVARLSLFASEPILEDDYQRYLWDGAVVASGLNPYAMSPAAELADGSTLARQGELVVKRINHAELKTIYPPVAQTSFALAYLLKPWSLGAWRSVILVCDLATLALILALLREAGRSPLWVALYWWNPVAIKELFNSAHMDAVVLPLTLLALLLATRRRQVLAATTLAFAVGAKIWPVLLLPLVLRPAVLDLRRLVAALFIFGGLVALWATPILLGGLDDSSGFVAYLSSWQTNSALFPALECGTATLLGWTGLAIEKVGLIVRAMLALCLGAFAVLISHKPIARADDLMGRTSLVVAALVLLSPAQYPWYAVWFAPFLAFRPWTGFLLLTATVPLYYTGFHFLARQRADVFREVVVWIIWLPVWAALAIEAARRRTGRSSA